MLMREVTEAEFYAFIKAHRDDPMPSVERPEVTLWRTQKGVIGRTVARSYPGWRNPGDPERYEIQEA